MKHRIRTFAVRKMPVGIALSPFEFAIQVGYLIASGKLLFDLAISDHDVLVKALPFTGIQLGLWLALLFVGSLTGAVGLFLVGRPGVYIGLQVERAGLVLVGAAITTYLAGIIELIGWNAANITLVATAFQLAAFVIKIAQISQVLGNVEK